MSQRSAVLPEKFGRLEVRETEIPKPGPHQLLVKVHSAAFNPVDYKIQQSGRFFDTFPRVLGNDVAGTVEAVGSEVTDFKKGDRVFSFVPLLGAKEATTEIGGFQQYTLVLDVGTGIIPSNVDFDAASTIPLGLSTAADGFYNFLNLTRPGGPGSSPEEKQGKETILIWGGASSVGQFAIQLAKNAGYHVITTASKSSHAALRDLGADIVLDYHDSDVVSQIAKHSPTKLTTIYDAISSAATVKTTLDCLPDGGKIAYTQLTPETAQVDCPSNISYTRVFAGSLLATHRQLGQEIFAWASKALVDGRLRPSPVTVREGGLDGCQATLDYYREHGISNSKFVIHP